VNAQVECEEQGSGDQVQTQIARCLSGGGDGTPKVKEIENSQIRDDECLSDLIQLLV
jgi:hypothetical protein